jgi:hypothetical protein
MSRRAPVEPEYISQGATFGGLGDIYRYSLWREWDPDKPTVIFLMLNPSTADENVLDPTLRRCLGYAMNWGYGRMEILNLFALRSTDPSALYVHRDPVGWQNNVVIVRACERRDRLVVAAWGTHGTYRGRDREVINLVTRQCGKDLHCLVLTKEGIPGHPLYLSKELKPALFRAGNSHKPYNAIRN